MYLPRYWAATLHSSISSAVSQTIGATERELERGEELLESVEAEQGEGS